MLKREIKVTQDGSKTLFIPEWNESYHSKHGAVREALHVFIENGLKQISNKEDISILEFGFGTGLNALLTSLYALKTKQKIRYTTLEKYPVEASEISKMGFEEQISEFWEESSSAEIQAEFLALHKSPWQNFYDLNPFFSIQKSQTDFREFKGEADTFDLVYFDAFGMRVQPELWEEEIFRNIHHAMKSGGLLTTYASNGQTQRALKACGFEIMKKPGPPGKREMLNAWKR